MTPRNTTPEGFRTAAYLATKARLDAAARSRTGKTSRAITCTPPNVKCGGRCIPPSWDCRLKGEGADTHLRAVRTDPVSGLANIERGVQRIGKGVRKGSFSEIEGGKRAIVRGVVKAIPGDLQRKKALQAQLERRAGGIALGLSIVGFGLFSHSQLKRAPFYRDGVGRQIDDAVSAGLNRILDATPGIAGARRERRAAGAAVASAAIARAAGEAATGPAALRSSLLSTPTQLERRATDYANSRVLLNRVSAVDVDAAGRGANAETWRQKSLEAFWSTKRTNAAGVGDGSTFSEPATHEFLSRQFGFRLGAGASAEDVRRQLTSALNREAASLQALARQQGVNIRDATQRSAFLNRLVGPSTANFPENVRERAVDNLNQVLGAAPRSREAAVSRTELANRLYRETRDGFDSYFGRIADEVRQTPGAAMPTEQRSAGYGDLMNSARIGHARYLAQRLNKPENVTSRIGQGLSDAISKEYFARQVSDSSTFTLSDRETRVAASELAGRNITGLADATRYLQQNGFPRLVPVQAARSIAPAGRPATPPRGRRSAQAQITDLARSLREAAQRRGEDMSLAASYRAARAEIERRQRGDALRGDAAGKPCGSSHIPKAHECRKGAGSAPAKTATERGTSSGRAAATAAVVAAGAALTVGGLLAYKQRSAIVPSLSQKTINAMSSAQVKAGLDKLPARFQEPARQLVGSAKKAAAHMALEAQGGQIRAVDVKNNFSTWEMPNGTQMSVGSVGDSLLTFGAERKGNVSKFPQYGLGFTIDSSYDAKGGMPGAQAKQLIRTTKAMYQAQLEMLPENAVMFAVPHKADGKGGKRKSIYEGMGFKPIPGLKTDRLWALKNQGKFTEIPDAQMEYMAGLIRGDRADAAPAGKPCGNSYIPKAHECSKTAGADNYTKKSETGLAKKRLAIAAAALTGAAALAITAPRWTPAAQRILDSAKPFDKNNPPQGAKYLTEGVSSRTWISQDDKYVIKTPKGKIDKAAFANEVKTQKALSDAGVSVPKIHNVDPAKGVVMMDYLKNYDTVKSLTKEQRGTAVQNALSEVEKMHRLGYSHGDLHMGNVLTKGTDVKLIDFGNAGPVAKKGLSDINNLLDAAKDSNPRLYSIMLSRKKALQTKISSGEPLTQNDLLAFHEGVRKDLRRPT